MPKDDRQPSQECKHTADLGIEVTAATRGELFGRTALALAHLVIERDTVAPIEKRELTVAGDRDADLMRDLLTALLCLFTVDGFSWCDVSVNETSHGLWITVKGEPFDQARHQLRGEVKTMTFHQLAVTRSASGWRARVILDV
jgi:SHS2 domain-containing protein